MVGSTLGVGQGKRALLIPTQRAIIPAGERIKPKEVMSLIICTASNAVRVSVAVMSAQLVGKMSERALLVPRAGRKAAVRTAAKVSVNLPVAFGQN